MMSGLMARLQRGLSFIGDQIAQLFDRAHVLIGQPAGGAQFGDELTAHEGEAVERIHAERPGHDVHGAAERIRQRIGDEGCIAIAAASWLQWTGSRWEPAPGPPHRQGARDLDT